MTSPSSRNTVDVCRLSCGGSSSGAETSFSSGFGFGFPKSLPKSPERLPVDKADATLEELEALPNGEALRAADAIKESGIAGSESNSANNRFVLFVTKFFSKFFFRKETPWEAGKHKGDTRFITPHMAAINHFPEQAMRSAKPPGPGSEHSHSVLVFERERRSRTESRRRGERGAGP